MGVWNGEITVSGVSKEGAFKVFDSNGAWFALFGKLLLKMFKAVHDYDLDIVKIPKGDDSVQLQNQHPQGGGTSSLEQCTNSKGDHCTSPSRQVPHDNNKSEPVDLAVSQTAPLGEKGQDNEKRISFQWDHRTSPSRQVFQHNGFMGELVDEAISEQTDESGKQETLQNQHPLTQDGNKRCTKEERAKWRVANGLKEKKPRTDQTSAKHKRLGKLPWKETQPIFQSCSPTETPPTNDIPNSPDPSQTTRATYGILMPKNRIPTPVR
jgi:hypothetical protein